MTIVIMLLLSIYCLFLLAYICDAAVVPSVSCVGSISQNEYNGLLSLFYAANGNFWVWNSLALPSTIWSFPANLSTPCTKHWQGLNCSVIGSQLCSITAVNLISKNLTGYIPSAISGLSHVVAIDLSDNCLEGSIPHQIFNIASLQQLTLASNRLTGNIPAAIGNVLNLVDFDVGFNRMTGTLPIQLSMLKNLETINVQVNQFNGTIPSVLGNLRKLTTLNINLNIFYGTLSPWLFNATSLVDVDLGSNFFVGSIPPEIGQWVNLQQLNMVSNRITGVIPTQIGNLKQVQDFVLDNNHLYGPIPTEIGSMTSMLMLFLEQNLLTGCIPSEIGGLANSITQISLYGNYLMCTVPSQIGLLTQLSALYMSYNHLSHHLPLTLGNMSNIVDLDFGYNRLTGSIPCTIGRLTTLEYLLLGVNSFTSFIPTEVGAMKHLRYFLSFDNMLVSTIPTEFGLCNRLLALVLSQNRLTGSIPLQLLNASKLQYIFFNELLLSGPIPNAVNSWPDLICFEASLTHITGTLPSNFGQATLLQYLEIYATYLTGTIPSEIGKCKHLNILSMGENFFMGTLPSAIQQFPHLSQLNLSRNFLTGSIESSSSNITLILQTLDISENAFTGTIPTYMLYSSALTTVIMYSNCFLGTLPDALCFSPQLEIIVLDSVTSSPICDFKYDSTIVKGTFPKHLLDGSIPSCLWNLRKLTTLHLSGNGLMGTLSEIPSSSALVDLTLSHNHLVGTIPMSVQTHGKFQQLGLSFNRIGGTLSSSFVMPKNITLFDLSVNRLSGEIPQSIVEASPVTILTGNIFMCQEADANTIPESDPQFLRYNCGSRNYNRCLYLWLIITCGLVVVYFIVRSFIGQRKFGSSLKEFLYSKFVRYAFHFEILPKQLKAPFTSEFLFHLKSFCFSACFLALFYLVVCMNTYVVLKDGNSTMAGLYSLYELQYTWITTSAYLHGAVPAVCILVFLFVTVFALDTTFQYLYERQELRDSWNYIRRFLSETGSATATLGASNAHPVLADSVSSSESGTIGSATVQNEKYSPAPWLSWTCAYRLTFTIIAQIIYAAVTIIVNIAYVYVTLGSVSPSVLNSLQLVLGLYKLWYNAMVKPWVVYRIPWLTKSQRLLHMTFMSLFTFIAGPYIATFVTHSNCFRYAILGQPLITSTFIQPEITCHAFCPSSNVDCIELCDFSLFHSGVVTTAVPAPWLYSYQCSSALLTSFLPVLVLTFLLSGIVIPTFLYIVSLYRIRMRARAAAKGSVVELNPMGKGRDGADTTVQGDESQEPTTTAHDTELSTSDSSNYVSAINSIHNAEISARQPATAPTASSDENKVDSDVDVIGVPTLISKMILNGAVLITYGMASPLLGITVAIDGIVVAMFWRGYIENFCRVPPSKLDDAIRKLECTTRHASAGMEGSMFMVIVFLAFFWSLTMLDMVGDVYGTVAGCCCILLSLVGVPLFYVLLPEIRRFRNKDIVQARPTVVQYMDSESRPSPLALDNNTASSMVDVEIVNSTFHSL